jgi:hypothetical protein
MSDYGLTLNSAVRLGSVNKIYIKKKILVVTAQSRSFTVASFEVFTAV